VRHTVMAVDDLQINLMILEAILEEDYNVICVTSGEEALARLAEEPKPDLMLLDLSMPVMDGFELLAKMREDPSLAVIPAIFVTGERDQYSEERGLNLGAVDYIKKPYVPHIIRIKVRNHIELKSYRDNLTQAVAERTRELIATHSAIVMGMSLLSESRDQITGSHLARIKTLSNILASIVSARRPDVLSSELVDSITTYSPLHDVGKVSVPDAVLNKKGTLTEVEFEQMKRHTTGGGDLLRQIALFLPGEQKQLSVAIEIAESHHERYDGSGYPKGLRGNEIPLSARIVAVVDVYDALRSPRPYKRGFTHQEAMDIILKGDGRTEPSHFDPVALKAFLEVHEELQKAYDLNPDPHILDDVK